MICLLLGLYAAAPDPASSQADGAAAIIAAVSTVFQGVSAYAPAAAIPLKATAFALSGA